MSFTFIDLFAGIGGIRIAFERAGGKCVFSSEYDKFAQVTYKTFFGDSPTFEDIFPVNPPGDITKIPPELIPDHEVLTGGFPCQPFSIAGVSKKNSLGRPHGFADLTQGTLFFNVQKIIDAKQPKAFLLENVKNLVHHDHGNTYKVIMNVFDELGYSVFPRIINAAGFVPQHRERIYMVGFRRPDKTQKWNVDTFDELNSLKPERDNFWLGEILENYVPEKYTVTQGTWNTLERHKKHHQEAGNGFGYGLNEPPFANVSRTLSHRYHKDGAEVLISQANNRPRRLTPLECCRLMGFPEEFQKYFARLPELAQPVSDLQAYKQFGNSVAVPVVTAVAKLIANKLKEVGAIE